MILAWTVVNLVPVIATAAAAALLIWAGRMYWVAFRRYKNSPWCVRCRYACHGLPEPRCPECGRPLARRPGPLAICRRNRLIPTALVLSLGAAGMAAWGPQIPRLYRVLPDRSIAMSQAGAIGPLSQTLLPEFDRRLGGPRARDFAALTVRVWLERSHHSSPLVRAQFISGVNATRIGFRKLERMPAAIERASALAPTWVQVQKADATAPLLRVDMSYLTAGAAMRSMACDLSTEDEVKDLRVIITPILPKATPFNDVLGGLRVLAPTRSGAPATVHAETSTGNETRNGYPVFITGAPDAPIFSESFDIVLPDGGTLRFLGWEWLSEPGVITFVEDLEVANTVGVAARR